MGTSLYINSGKNETNVFGESIPKVKASGFHNNGARYCNFSDIKLFWLDYFGSFTFKYTAIDSIEFHIL